VLARKAFLNPACQNEVGLVAVVPRVLRLEPRRPLPDGRLSDHLAVSELIPRQINFHASRKPIPHVRFRSLAVAEDVRRQDFSAKDVVQDQRRNVALPARGIARRPSIVLFRRIEAPAGSDGAFDLSERVHRTRVPTSGDIPERWPHASHPSPRRTWPGPSGFGKSRFLRVPALHRPTRSSQFVGTQPSARW